MENKPAKRVRILGMAMLLIVMAALVLAEVNRARGGKLLETYLVLIPAFFAGMAFLMPLRRSHDYWLGLVWMGWFVLSRVLLGDLYFVRSSYDWFVLDGLACMVALPFAWLMQDGARRHGLYLASGLLAGAISLLAWIAVIASLNEQVITLPGIGGSFGLIQYGSTKYTLRLSITPHANISAALIALAIMLGVWLIAATRRRWAAVAFFPLFVGLYTAFALTMSRTNMIQLAFFAAVVLFLLLVRRITPAAKHRLLRLFGALAASAVVFAVIFQSSYWVLDGFNAVQRAVFNQKHSITSEQSFSLITNASAEAPAATPKPTKAPKLWQVRSRPLEKDLATMTGRTQIYREVIEDLLSNPKKLLLGVTNRFAAMPGDYAHAHNAFLQVTVCLGLPALLMALWFCIRAVWLCARIVLLHLKAASAADLVLVSMVLTILLGTIPEAYLFYTGETYLCNIVFFLLYGYLIETERRLRPAA